MIVISSSLVLSAGEDSSPDHPVVGWRNLVAAGNVAADSEEVDYPATNLANPSTALLWVAADEGEQYLTVTIDTVGDVDYLAVARHNFGSAAIPVSVQGRADILDPWAELVGEVILADDGPVLFRFEPQGLAEVRLKMAAGNAAPTAAVLYVGKLLILQRKIYVGHTPMPYGRDANIVNGKSESGQFLGRIVLGESTETSIDLQNITPSWYRAEMDPFILASKEAPFFFAWRPASYPREVGYAWMTNSPKPQNARRNGMMSIQLQMSGISI